MTSKVFNIQKFSLHDGPGIRTAVFFKGCNLKCNWCSNPESQRQEIEVFTDTSACTSCGACTAVCKNTARRIGYGKLSLDYDNCICCLECKKVCKSHAVSLVGKEYTLLEIMSEVKKDLVFYEQGGGVTLTGGEIFMQYDFVIELCKLLKHENIHIAVETSGFTSSNKFKSLAEYCDLIYIDLKHYDNGKHIDGTGVPIFPIVENILWMAENDKNFIVRIPVIPDYNDSLSDAEGYAHRLAEMNVKQVQLLPFHSLGAKKYEFLGKEYIYRNYSSLVKDDLEEYKNILQSNGVIVSNGAR
jgi:pyruvate formate lyase activating enzyme